MVAQAIFRRRGPDDGVKKRIEAALASARTCEVVLRAHRMVPQGTAAPR